MEYRKNRDEEYKEKVIAEGVDAYMSKPYDAEELLGTVNRLLNNSKEKDEK